MKRQLQPLLTARRKVRRSGRERKQITCSLTYTWELISFEDENIASDSIRGYLALVYNSNTCASHIGSTTMLVVIY